MCFPVVKSLVFCQKNRFFGVNGSARFSFSQFFDCWATSSSKTQSQSFKTPKINQLNVLCRDEHPVIGLACFSGDFHECRGNKWTDERCRQSHHRVGNCQYRELRNDSCAGRNEFHPKQSGQTLLTVNRQKQLGNSKKSPKCTSPENSKSLLEIVQFSRVFQEISSQKISSKITWKFQ